MKRTITLGLFFVSSVLFYAVQAQEPKNYGFEINGEVIGPGNYQNITTIPGVSGMISYTPETKVLKMQNAELLSIRNMENEGMTIQLTGNNSVRTTRELALAMNVSTRITGHGTLMAASRNNPAILIAGSKMGSSSESKTVLTVDGGCTLTAIGTQGICGRAEDKGGGLIIDGATVKATGAMGGSVVELLSFELRGGCAIRQPKGAVFDAEETHSIVDALGQVVKTEVIIEPIVEEEDYGFSIVGIPITSLNYQRIGEIEGVTGSVVYNPQTKVLTLDGASIQASGQAGIWNRENYDMVVSLMGKNKIVTESRSFGGITFSTSGRITGHGELDLSATYSGILLGKPTGLRIDGTCKLVISGGTFGMRGCNKEFRESIRIDGAPLLKVIGLGGGSIAELGYLGLENGSQIWLPRNARFSGEKCAVVDANGEIVKTEILISNVAPESAEKVETEPSIEAYTHEGYLYLTLPCRETLYIYDLSGVLLSSVNLSAGEHRVALPERAFLLRVGDHIMKTLD